VLAHGFSVLARGVGAYLDVEELVLGLLADVDLIAALLERGEEAVGVLTVGDCGDLNEKAS
jgi:hypothetical protein